MNIYFVNPPLKQSLVNFLENRAALPLRKAVPYTTLYG